MAGARKGDQFESVSVQSEKACRTTGERKRESPPQASPHFRYRGRKGRQETTIPIFPQSQSVKSKQSWYLPRDVVAGTGSVDTERKTEATCKRQSTKPLCWESQSSF